MKTNINKESFIKNNLLNSSIKQINVSSLGLTICNLKLQLNNVYFKDIDEIDVVLKNVKTKDIFIGESSINNNIINIDLKSLNSMCTDNEFMLLLIIKKDGIYSFINPIIKGNYHDISDNFINLDLNNIEWYLRVLENGEIRLSAIVKKSKLNHITNNMDIIL